MRFIQRNKSKKKNSHTNTHIKFAIINKWKIYSENKTMSKIIQKKVYKIINRKVKCKLYDATCRKNKITVKK